MVFISDEPEKFGGIQNYCLLGKNWMLHVLYWPISKSSEKLMLV